MCYSVYPKQLIGEIFVSFSLGTYYLTRGYFLGNRSRSFWLYGNYRSPSPHESCAPGWFFRSCRPFHCSCESLHPLVHNENRNGPATHAFASTCVKGGKLIDLKSYTKMADFGDFRFPYRFEKLCSMESDFRTYSYILWSRDFRVYSDLYEDRRLGDTQNESRRKNLAPPGIEHVTFE